MRLSMPVPTVIAEEIEDPLQRTGTAILPISVVKFSHSGVVA